MSMQYSQASGINRRVAGYARVSTDKDEQENSFDAQVDFYTNLINSREDWTMVEVYTDEGLSGLSTKRRDGFQADLFGDEAVKHRLRYLL
jgi:predicted site-specific integrase-resolvase